MQGMQKPTVTTSVPAPTATPYKMATSSVTTTASPKQTALMKKTGRTVTKAYPTTNVK